MKGGPTMNKTYTTIEGDMWDKIAYEQMGSVLYMDKLVKANAGHAATVIFPAGVVLTIPRWKMKWICSFRRGKGGF